MRRRVITGVLALAAIVAVVLAIRSWTVDDGDRARASVERFGNAVAAKNYGLICEDLLADDLRQRLAAIGLPCERALATGLGEVREPRVRITSVAVADDRASVGIETTAAGQRPSRDVLQLREADGEWRIVSLGQGTTTAGTPPTPARTSTTSRGSATTPAPTPQLPAPDAPPNGFDDPGATPARGSAAAARAERRRQREIRRLARKAMREQGTREK